MIGLRSVAPSLSLAFLSALIITAACEDDSIGADDAAESAATVFCSHYYGCGCEAFTDQPFSSEAQCQSFMESAVQGQIDEGLNAGLHYDGSCVARYIDFLDRIGCKSASQAGLATLAEWTAIDACKWFYGDSQGGQSCESLQQSNGDSCIRGYRCVDGVCTASNPLPGPGEPCEGLGDTCANEAWCLDVDQDGDFFCEVRPGAGEVCLGTADICAAGLTCNQSSKTCEPAPGEDQACAPALSINSRCAEGLVCDVDEICKAAPTGGESCIAGQCASGFTCTNGVCAQEAPLVCGATPTNG